MNIQIPCAGRYAEQRDFIYFMKEASVNSVTLGIFSWAVLEPQEGVYCFEWPEHIMDRLEEEIQVVDKNAVEV